jgi:hypothetical protein
MAGIFGIAVRGLGKALVKRAGKKISPTIKSVKPTTGQSETIGYKIKSLPKRVKAIYEAERLKRGK